MREVTNITNREYWGWISTIDFINHNRISKMLKIYKNIKEIYNTSLQELIAKTDFTSQDCNKIIESKEKFNSKKYFENLEKNNIKFLCVDDKEYPEKLLPYEHKPYYIFYKGTLPDPNLGAVAMVGARACSNYGRSMAKSIAKELSMKNVQIISGMARGIDTYSQLGALEGNGRTFAVLGCGVDICYPTENIELYKKIIKKGGIISEYPPGSKPLAWHFPERNRIISGLSDKVIVIEAKEKSGSLITVEWALEQGKDVMALPGPINSCLSKGCNRLIKAGAGIITSTKDILNELKYVVFSKYGNNNVKQNILEKDFSLVYSDLRLEPKNVETVMEDTNLTYEKVIEILLQLQLEGLVEEPFANYYSKKR